MEINWHIYPNEKPIEETKYIISDGENSDCAIWLNNKFVFYNPDTNKYYIYTDIIAWAELPSPPKLENYGKLDKCKR